MGMLGISKFQIERRIRGGLVMPQDANLRDLIDRLSKGVVDAIDANNKALDKQIGAQINKQIRDVQRYGI
jgi:hypothetical protein